MPKTADTRERRHQPVWDTLIRGTPGNYLPRATLVGGPIRMFTTAQAGNIAVTNMEGAGSFPAGQTYLILAMRSFIYFRGMSILGNTQADFQMYHQAVSQLYFTLSIGNKEYFAAPVWYMPSGGGLAGDVGTSTDVFFTNGVPSHGSILRLARSVSLTPFQNFVVLAQVSTLGAQDFAANLATAAAGETSIQVMLDGLQLRDVL